MASHKDGAFNIIPQSQSYANEDALALLNDHEIYATRIVFEDSFFDTTSRYITRTGGWLSLRTDLTTQHSEWRFVPNYDNVKYRGEQVIRGRLNVSADLASSFPIKLMTYRTTRFFLKRDKSQWLDISEDGQALCAILTSVHNDSDAIPAHLKPKTFLLNQNPTIFSEIFGKYQYEKIAPFLYYLGSQRFNTFSAVI